jgi:hypothetical protein
MAKKFLAVSVFVLLMSSVAFANGRSANFNGVDNTNVNFLNTNYVNRNVNPDNMNYVNRNVNPENMNYVNRNISRVNGSSAFTLAKMVNLGLNGARGNLAN